MIAAVEGWAEQDIPVNYSNFCSPVTEPTLRTDTQAFVAAPPTSLMR